MSPPRDIIVVGGSKGSHQVLTRLVSGLPAGLPAAVFVVVHLPFFPPSSLPEVLGRAGRLEAAFADHGEPILHGRIYVAPANRHLRIAPGRIHLRQGPPERGHRPAIDTVFRSAAESFGPRVVGVVISGLLRDGAAGLALIKGRGGVAVVQDPEDAAEPSMPRHALASVDVDHCVPAAALAPLLVKLAHGVDGAEPDSPEVSKGRPAHELPATPASKRG